MACFDLDEENRVVGGSHCLFCLDNKRAIVVTDTKDGVYMVGDYRRVLPPSPTWPPRPVPPPL